MTDIYWDKAFLEKRGLITNGYCLPYNPKLLQRADELRKRMTPTERKLWHKLFKNSLVKVMRQRVIDNYIVDFYCASCKLVIEIDGSVHDSEEAKIYDEERTQVLNAYGLKVIRFTNVEVKLEFEKVCHMIKTELEKS